MKPVRLEFSGLHSYRERQIVDFEALGSTGLFGIFGPTGAGKSSILDAITLALYGTVERASRGTRGVINQMEKQLYVRFEFMLGDSRYVVERRYRKDKSDPDKSVVQDARLWQADSTGQAERVIASRTTDTTNAVEALLGLKQDEFCRAVVLPQGKFDQFLKLTGGDRARMLEHIFCLEQFGDDLAAKAKQVVSDCEAKGKAIEAAMTELGDCSSQALSAAEKNLEDAKAAERQARLRRQQTEQRYLEAVELFKLYAERNAAIQRKKDLDDRNEEIYRGRLRLDAARRADPLRHLMTEEKNLNRSLEELQNRLQEKSGLEAQAGKEAVEAGVRLKSAEEARDRQVPELEKRCAELEQARQKAGKIAGLKRLERQQERQLHQKRRELELLKQNAGQLEREIQNDHHLRAKLAGKRSSLEVEPDFRERLDLAYQALLSSEKLAEALDQAKAALAVRERELEQCWAVAAQLVAEMLPGAVIGPDTDLDRLTAGVTETARQQLDQAREELVQALIRGRAADLARNLQRGKPCPVCGSLEHPAPVAPVPQDREEFDRVIEQAKARQKEVQRWRERTLKAWTSWESARSEAEQTLAEYQAAVEAQQAAEREFSLRAQEWQADPVKVRAARRDLEKADREAYQLSKQIEEIDGRLSESEPGLRDIQRDLSQGELSAASIERDLTATRAQKSELAAELLFQVGGEDPVKLLDMTSRELETLRETARLAAAAAVEARQRHEALAREISHLAGRAKAVEDSLKALSQQLQAELTGSGFDSREQAWAGLMEEKERRALQAQVDLFDQETAAVQGELERLERAIAGRQFSQENYLSLQAEYEKEKAAAEEASKTAAIAASLLRQLQEKRERWKELERRQSALKKRLEVASQMVELLKGRKLVQFLGEEHLRDMAQEASLRLGRLTGQRYALELSGSSEFVMRDDFNGGQRRPVSSLSGGETFLTSLALALALSSKAQLRGLYPLGFFFLDEGFGSLDQERLDLVVGALEKLHDTNRIVGVISHVRDLRERMPQYLEVIPAGENGSGSSRLKMVKS